MQWDSYELYYPGVSAPLHTLPRREARQAYNKLMREKPERIALLRRLLAANGVELADTDAGIQALNDWFAANVEPNPEKPGFLTADWYSVVNDIALFLGDAMIARCPSVHWLFFTGGKKNVAYQWHVLMGFPQHPKIPLDLQPAVATYGHRLVIAQGSIPHYGKVMVRGVEIDLDRGREEARKKPVERDAFLQWVRIWT